MLSSPAPNRFLWTGALLGAALGAGILFLLPIAESKPVFLLALPFACLFLIVVVLDVRLVIALVLFSRALLDPLLNLTKSGGGFGMGAVLNLFVILLAGFLALPRIGELSANRFFRRWALFLVICLASALLSPFREGGIRLLFTLASYLSMAALPFLVDPVINDKKRWLKVLAWSSVLPVLYANVDFLRGGQTFEDAGARISGSFTHPNILAFYLVLVIAVLFLILRSAQFRVKGWRLGVVLIYMADIFFLLIETKTRSAWISCWLLFFLYGLLRERKFMFIAIAAAFAALALPNVASRAMDLESASSGGRVNSYAWRVALWKSSLPFIWEKPFLGWGPSSFHELSRSFFVMERSSGVDAHNTYVQVLFETGVLGLLSYLSIHLGVLRLFWSRVRHALPKLSAEYAVALAYLAGYLISSYSDNMLYYLGLNWYFWFFIGVLLKSARFHGFANLSRNPVV